MSPEDATGRALVTGWFRDLGLEIHTDVIGNCWAIRAGKRDLPPVVMKSHIDTVATDGVLGVLGGLEVIESMIDADIATEHPVAVAFFTNEEGARFAPDMMGSGVCQGSLDLEEMLAQVGIDGVSVSAALEAIGAVGPEPVGALMPYTFLELYIEQGPLLKAEHVETGVVTGVQGISWIEFAVTGQSAHAGTTPMKVRQDAGVVAARIALDAREIVNDIGPPQVSNVGRIRCAPDLVNVVPEEAILTVDLRHTGNNVLHAAETRLFDAADSFAAADGCTVERRRLAWFDPVNFDPGLLEEIVTCASRIGLSNWRMPSGAGHDAEMFATNCPAAMIFVPSKDGISHNIQEYTAPQELANGVRLVAEVALVGAGIVQPERLTT